MPANNRNRKGPPKRPQNSKRPQNARKPQKSRDEVRREQALKRRQQKRRKQAVFYTFSFLLLIVVGIILSLTVFFKVEKVTVVGKTIYDNEKIIKTSGIKIGDNLFLTDKQKSADRIKQSLPYIGDVKISNKIPDEIVIDVKKTSEKCAVKNGETYVLTNERGKVLQVGVTDIDEKLTMIFGGDVKKAEIGKNIEFKNKETYDLLDEIMSLVKKYNVKDITQVDISDKMDVKIVYQDRIDLLFGSFSQIDKKMKFAVEIIEKEDERSKNQEGIIDLQGLSSDKGGKDKAYFRQKDEKTTALQTPNTDSANQESDE